MKKIVMGIFLIIIVACSPKVTTDLIKSYPMLDYNEEVIMLGISDETPSSAIKIGIIRIGDTGFSTNCGWDVVKEIAKNEARKAGGNVIKIIEHIPPDFMSSCDRMTAEILKVENPEDMKKLILSGNEIIDSTWNYAKLFVFRPGGTGVLIGYDLYLGDSVICRVKSNSRQELKITKKGLNTLWAKTEAKVEVPVDIEFGREYYLRCGITMGIMVGRPQLELVDRKQGKTMYDSIKE
jgi:hypothetical protein